MDPQNPPIEKQPSDVPQLKPADSPINTTPPQERIEIAPYQSEIISEEPLTQPVLQTKYENQPLLTKTPETKEKPQSWGTFSSTSTSSNSYSIPKQSKTRRTYTSISDVKSDNESEDDEIKPRDFVHPLEEKHQILNQMFGFKPWKQHVVDKPFEKHSDVVKALYYNPKDTARIISTPPRESRLTLLGNVVWSLLFGWWIFLLYAFVAAIMAITYIGLPYARISWKLGKYYFYPFGKFLVEIRIRKGQQQKPTPKTVIAKIFFSIFAIIPAIGHFIAMIMTWMPVVLIPMAKINLEAIKILFTKPLRLEVIHEYPGPGAEVIMCTFQATNMYYYKYSVGGVNVVFFNFLPFVLICIFFGYIAKYFVKPLYPGPIIIFLVSALSVFPVSYYIGNALSRISAQTSFGVGAVLNATFGSIVELIVYCSMVLQNDLNQTIQCSIVGSLMTDMLLIPGLSMIIGGLRHREQHFNPVSAGVSGILLLVSVIGAFTPSIFFAYFGTHQMSCTDCSNNGNASFACDHCYFLLPNSTSLGSFYDDKTLPLIYFCVAILPVIYIIGLIFTLKTHSHLVEETDIAAEEQPVGPEWSKFKCIVILLAATGLFALIAEEFVDALEPTLEVLHVSQSFVGVTVLAIVPSFGELSNAIQFAWSNNFPMSLEIGNSAAVQILLIQVPVIVLFTLLFGETGSFVLIFPLSSLFCVLFSVIILNYISIDGRANYFEGFALLFCWFFLIASFFFLP